MAVFNEDCKPDVPLQGTLAEFRTALRHEIEAARKHESSSAVPLVNGHRLANIGSSVQYKFEAENILNVPGDTPGDLYVPDRAPIQVEIISVDGTIVILSVPIDLGAFVPTARLQSNLAHLMRKLIERIEALADSETPVADRVLGKKPVAGKPESNIHFNSDPNKEQRQAVACSLGFNTTFIWGPPGTGKTTVIGDIGRELLDRQRSLLLVSHTNNAVDQALLAIGSQVAEEHIEAGHVIRVGDPVDKRLQECPELLARTHVERRSEKLTARRNELVLEQATRMSRLQTLSADIDLWEWVQDADDDISDMSSSLDDLGRKEKELDDARTLHIQLSRESSYWLEAKEAAIEMSKVLAQLSNTKSKLASARAELDERQYDCDAAEGELNEAQALLTEVSSIGWLKRKWKGLPSPEEQEREVVSLRADLSKRRTALANGQRSVAAFESTLEKCLDDTDAFERKYGLSPDDLISQSDSHVARLVRLRTAINDLAVDCRDSRAELNALLHVRVSALDEWGLHLSYDDSLQGMLDAIREAYATASTQVAGLDIRQMIAERNMLRERMTGIEIELRQIEDMLERIEEIVIAEAMIIATTLTRSYLRDAIQARRFDTIVLDEASMAPIPALWVAASLADANAVVIGDPEQLPPIVLSNDKLAEKWLGRDVFEVVEATRESPDKPYLVKLKEQYRMHPDISLIPNSLIYEDLRDGPLVKSSEYEAELEGWYRQDWGHDHPVLLVDTGSLGAWVTSVSRGSRSSRLNFLSATVCVDIAELLLQDGRPSNNSGKRRIIIVSPYRPHANLTRLLLREQKLDEDVAAGTAHSFQGSEAEVVIFDLVNDDPHWRVAMFMPQNDDTNKRLINVALTRARHRLIIVGDFSYNASQAKKAFLGRELIPFLTRHYPMVHAREIVPEGFAARAAKITTKVYGGSLESKHDRIIVTQETFFQFLCQDFAKARERIVVYSAFMTQERLSILSPQLRAACERGVEVFIVTKCLEERKSKESAYRTMEQALADWGVTVIHKRGMHEKLVFVDDSVLWSGSLNPLSFSSTQEVMERRISNDVFVDYWQTMHLDDLLGEYADGQPDCPICGREVTASEGRVDPFRWRCVQDGCYSRGIDQPRIEGGVVVCAKCGEGVEYGEWGGKASWRCVDNRRHHQEIARTHLRLPKMRALVPKPELRRLDKLFGIGKTKADIQPSLFSEGLV